MIQIRPLSIVVMSFFMIISGAYAAAPMGSSSIQPKTTIPVKGANPSRISPALTPAPPIKPTMSPKTPEDGPQIPGTPGDGGGSGGGNGGGGVPPTSDCTELCPRDCTFYLESPLYHGYCNASIELCNGSYLLAICQCNGQGDLPILWLGQKHIKYQ